MSRSDDKKLAALIKKTAAKVANTKPKNRQRYDETLPPEKEEDGDAQALFSEMKKRDF
ncbi:MAG TPA: hypothetical protein VD793_10985 [Gemmatimonadales bacterium]|nr:hypothetical protein [Gemmatimonadales bacterium]